MLSDETVGGMAELIVDLFEALRNANGKIIAIGDTIRAQKAAVD